MRTILVLAVLASAMAMSLASCGDSGGQSGTSAIPGERPLGSMTPGTSSATNPSK